MPAHPSALRRPAGLAAPSPRKHSGRRVLVMLVGLVLISSGCALSRLQTAASLARNAQPLQADPPGAIHRLLIVGDSTGVGTGASTPSHSVAGWIASRHPDWRIENRARSGAKCEALPAQLEGASPQDTVLIMCGSHDVLRLTGRDELHDSLLAATHQAARIAPRVILMPPGNIGNIPLLFAPFSWWMTERSRDLHDIGKAVARESGALYVDLFREREDDPFAREPERMHAADGLHPGDAGYALWADALRREAGV